MTSDIIYISMGAGNPYSMRQFMGLGSNSIHRMISKSILVVVGLIVSLVIRLPLDIQSYNLRCLLLDMGSVC